MRSAVLDLIDDDAEVSMNPYENLEANVVALRGEVNDFKDQVTAALARIDRTIESAVSRLEIEIRAAVKKAETELERFAIIIRQELLAQDARLRDRIDERADKLDAKYERLAAKIDQRCDKLGEKIDATNARLDNVAEAVIRIDAKLSALIWVVGGLGTFITIAYMVGKAMRWL